MDLIKINVSETIINNNASTVSPDNSASSTSPESHKNNKSLKLILVNEMTNYINCLNYLYKEHNKSLYQFQKIHGYILYMNDKIRNTNICLIKKLVCDEKNRFVKQYDDFDYYFNMEQMEIDYEIGQFLNYLLEVIDKNDYTKYMIQ